MNESTITPSIFATRAGLILMAVPSIFWLGIILAVGFEKPVIVHELMLPIDKISGALTLLIMIGLPLITFLIILNSKQGSHAEGNKLQLVPNVQLLLPCSFAAMHHHFNMLPLDELLNTAWEVQCSRTQVLYALP